METKSYSGYAGKHRRQVPVTKTVREIDRDRRRSALDWLRQLEELRQAGEVKWRRAMLKSRNR